MLEKIKCLYEMLAGQTGGCPENLHLLFKSASHLH